MQNSFLTKYYLFNKYYVQIGNISMSIIKIVQLATNRWLMRRFCDLSSHLHEIIFNVCDLSSHFHKIISKCPKNNGCLVDSLSVDFYLCYFE